MKKTKTIKEIRYETVIVKKETTREVSLWYIELLRWVFGADESMIKYEIEEEKQRAFRLADKTARSFKEDLMQKKLLELGYEVKNTFPMAKEMKQGDMTTNFDYNTPRLEIVDISTDKQGIIK